MADNIDQNQDQNPNNINQINDNDQNVVPVLNYDPTNTNSLINISRDYIHQKNIIKLWYI